MSVYNQYGKVAIEAVKLLNENQSFYENPKLAWQEARKAMKASDKGCPFGTFMALCQNGNVKNLRKRDYGARPRENKNYALKAVELLKEGKSYESKEQLWSAVIQYFPTVKENCQSDVLFALWHHNYLV